MISQKNLARLKLLEPARGAIGGEEEHVVLFVLDGDDVTLIADVLVASRDNAVTIGVLEHLQAETDALFLGNLTLLWDKDGVDKVVDVVLDVGIELPALIAVVLDVNVSSLKLAGHRCTALGIGGDRFRHVALCKRDRATSGRRVALAHVGGEVSVLHEHDREVDELTRSRGRFRRPCNVNRHRVFLVGHVQEVQLVSVGLTARRNGQERRDAILDVLQVDGAIGICVAGSHNLGRALTDRSRGESIGDVARRGIPFVSRSVPVRINVHVERNIVDVIGGGGESRGGSCAHSHCSKHSSGCNVSELGLHVVDAFLLMFIGPYGLTTRLAAHRGWGCPVVTREVGR